MTQKLFLPSLDLFLTVVRAPGMMELKVSLSKLSVLPDGVLVWEWSASAFDEGDEAVYFYVNTITASFQIVAEFLVLLHSSGADWELEIIEQLQKDAIKAGVHFLEFNNKCVNICQNKQFDSLISELVLFLMALPTPAQAQALAQQPPRDIVLDGSGTSLNIATHEPEHQSYFQKLGRDDFPNKDTLLILIRINLHFHLDFQTWKMLL
ncbi:Molybdenum cofactor sulfurase, C-terminal [Artemisia annua]|uniref:Molybdenum cofactor sulfurase, C-terminal n=1 Tax=Artemisia annua TaxID=35608 RepID=A0A2U1N942_ARTAN|nr:Molybdenum cofactor sulfurase, C-terminal [Artemisia annua]